ncbi:MAG: hypothetical protein Q8R40_05315 [bacterium]|nr:hypothetical protein [bacterium]MDZ4296653.1 hypothetical protein [Patescibacteria group bacterium]
MMLENHVYNLMNQMTEEHKSLWRIKHMYGKDAGDCERCGAFWKKMEADKEDHVRELAELIKGHL